jgi:ABC-type multidrug transport system permease subunit
VDLRVGGPLGAERGDRAGRAFPVLLPLVFASSAFVSTENMPDWLAAFAEHQPVTAAVDAMRALVLGGPWGAEVLASLAWTAGILLVFVPLSIKRYRAGAAG